MKSRLFFCLLAFLSLAGLPAAAQFAPVNSPTGPVMAGPYIVVDATTGETLLQSNPGASWVPASLTKLMTIYLTFSELKAGRLTLDTPVTFSQHASSQPQTALVVPAGRSITVDQALLALVALSANDVAAALAEKIGGSEPEFAQRMSQAAVKLGMTATTFGNANGLPNPTNVTTARDLAILGIALVKEFPQYYGYFLTRDFMFNGRLVGTGVKFVQMYSPYADGLKTGFVCASGFNLVGSAVRDGRRLIAVALGFRRADLRDEFMVRLFDEAFALKTAGSRQKVWQLRNEGTPPTPVFTQSSCGQIRYEMPGDAAWLGTYPNWATAKRVFDAGQAELSTLGATALGKEWILPVAANGGTRQAAIIADLEPDAAQRLCAAYKAKKQFCEVKKPAEIQPPFGIFLR